MKTLGTFLKVRNMEIAKCLWIYRKHNIMTDYTLLNYTNELKSITERVTNGCILAFPQNALKTQVFSFPPSKLRSNFPIEDLLVNEKMKKNVHENYKDFLQKIRYHSDLVNNYGNYHLDIFSDSREFTTLITGNGTYGCMTFSNIDLEIDELIRLVVARYTEDISSYIREGFPKHRTRF